MTEHGIPVCTAEDREKLFIALYKSVFPSVARYVSKMGGTFDEAKDVFQDALVIYYEKTVAGSADIKTNEKVYLAGISRHLWLKKFKADSLTTSMDGLEMAADADEEQVSDSKVLNFLQTAGKKCMDLLRSFYYDELPLTEAAKLFGFSGVRSATVQKYKCLEKVRETVKERSLTYEDFLN